MARHDHRVPAVAARPAHADDAAAQLAICGAMGLEIQDVRALVDTACFGGAAVIVDGLCGTGLTRRLDGTFALLVDSMNGSGVPVLALDVPSGLDCDTGEPLGPCVRAQITATFVAPKIGFDNPTSRPWTGEVWVVPIGAPAFWPLHP